MMLRANPVFTGIWRGLFAPGIGEAQRTYFACLLIQAAALALWWPKSSLIEALVREQGPEPLLATMVALGLTTAYYSLRAGAEEFLLAGQQSLREWTLSTPLSIGRIVGGSLLGHAVQTMLLLLFSLPLLAIAYSHGGSAWTPVGQILATVVVQAMLFYLIGATLYLRIGHHGRITYLVIRLVLAGTYVLTALYVPILSHLLIAVDALGSARFSVSFGVTFAPYQGFLGVHAVLIAALTAVLWAQLHRFRSRHLHATVESQ